MDGVGKQCLSGPLGESRQKEKEHGPKPRLQIGRRGSVSNNEIKLAEDVGVFVCE